MKGFIKHRITKYRALVPCSRLKLAASWLIFGMLYILFTVNNLSAQQIDIGLFETNVPGKLDVRLKPDFQINADQTISAILYTLRWDDPEISLALEYIFPYFIIPDGDTIMLNGYVYQVFVAIPMYPVGNDILPGQEIVVSSFLFNGSDCSFIEIVEDEWTAIHNGDYYCELQGIDRTGFIYEPIIAYGPAGGRVVGGGNVYPGQSTGQLELNDHIGTVVLWQRRHNNGAWLDIAGTAGLIVYEETTSTPGGWDFRAQVVEGSCPAVHSAPASVEVADVAAWTGLTNSSWHETSNWAGHLPSSEHNVVLLPPFTGNHPVISQYAESNDLLILPDAMLTLQLTASLTVNGTLSNEGGSHAILLEAGTEGTASLIHNNAGVEAIIGVYFDEWNTSPPGLQGVRGWRTISSMIENQPIQPVFISTPPDGTQKLLKWSEAEHAWINSVYGETTPYSWNTEFENQFIPGRGYLAASETSGNRQFTGVVNVNDLLLSGLTHTEGFGHTQAGWHLIGNPYSSAIDWFAGTWNRTNIGAYAQQWNSDMASFTVMRSNGEVGIGQGFMIYSAEGSNGSITVPADARLHRTSAKTQRNNNSDIILLAKDALGVTAQETIISINTAAGFNFDLEYDSKFIQGFAPSFYSYAVNGHQLALNTIPYINNGTSISLGFLKNDADEFTIELSRSIPDMPVILHDLMENTFNNLTDGHAYTFTSSEDDSPDRFVLLFGTVGVYNHERAQVKIWASKDLIYLYNPLNECQNISVFNLKGQLINSIQACEVGISTLSMSFEAGIYIVRINNKRGTSNTKIYISK